MVYHEAKKCHSSKADNIVILTRLLQHCAFKKVNPRMGCNRYILLHGMNNARLQSTQIAQVGSNAIAHWGVRLD